MCTKVRVNAASDIQISQVTSLYSLYTQRTEPIPRHSIIKHLGSASLNCPLRSSSLSKSCCMNLWQPASLLSCLNWILKKSPLKLFLARQRPSYSISINITVNQIFRRNTFQSILNLILCIRKRWNHLIYYTVYIQISIICRGLTGKICT